MSRLSQNQVVCATASDGRSRPSLSYLHTPVRVSLSLRSVTTYQVDGWTALGDPTRRAIFERLADGPSAVGALASEFPVSRPAVSQHLKVLKDAGLVTSSQAGNRRIYQADPRGVAAMRDQLDRFWNQALATFKEVVEQDTQEVS